MRNFILTLFTLVLFFPRMVMGQDVIVKRDGSTIISKVLEVTPNSIKYKKQSNLKGPAYTINMSDVLSIDYANGEIDKFEKPDNTYQPTSTTKATQQNSYINDAIISGYNDRSIKCTLKKKPKKIDWVYRHLNVHPQSVIGNNDGRLHISINHENNDDKYWIAYLNLSIENSTDVMMYVDLENCAFRKNKLASTFYINSSKTTSNGTSGGSVVNLGAIANAFGIGGIAGTIASGVSVGGNHSEGTSTTIYTQRIITIPPHSRYVLPDKVFYAPFVEKSYKKDFKFGDRFIYKQPNSLTESPWEIIVSYITEDDPNTVKRYKVGLYVSEEISVDSTWDKCIVNETGVAPIHYYYWTNN